MKRLMSAGVGACMLLVGIVGMSPTAEAALPTCDSYQVRQLRNGAQQYLPSYSYTGSFNCRLRRGDTGDGVFALQMSLVTCYGLRITVDGIFGPQTQAALKKAQKKARITVDGWYGPQSRDRLKLTMDPRYTRCISAK